MNYVEETKYLRISADTLIEACKVRLDSNSHEFKQSYDALRLGKAWLGKFLQSIGETTPYEVVDKVAEIPKTAERHFEVDSGFIEKIKPLPYLDFVNEMRAQIEFLRLSVQAKLPQTTTYAEVGYAMKYFAEARMWFGFELGNLRDNVDIAHG